MSRHATRRPAAGFTAIGTVSAFVALAVGGAAGMALFWTSVTVNPSSLLHTLGVAALLAGILAVSVFEARCVRGLLRAYRRQQ